MKLKRLSQNNAEVALKKRPDLCPYCGSDQMEGDAVDIIDDAMKSTQDLTCTICRAKFSVVYKIHDTTVITEPEFEPEEEE